MTRALDMRFKARQELSRNVRGPGLARPAFPEADLPMDTTSKRVDIIPAKRRAMILEWLRAHGAASIQELADDIGASASTIRRDLEHLMDTGHLERTHGGAVLLPPLQATSEFDASINQHMARPQKRAIGLAAAQRLNPRESVIFDSSTTVLEAARAAIERGLPLTAVTNSLDIALLCSTAAGIRVVVPGGMLRAGTPTLVGDPGETFLKTIHADVCMIGTHASPGRS